MKKVNIQPAKDLDGIIQHYEFYDFHEPQPVSQAWFYPCFMVGWGGGLSPENTSSVLVTKFFFGKMEELTHATFFSSTHQRFHFYKTLIGAIYNFTAIIILEQAICKIGNGVTMEEQLLGLVRITRPAFCGNKWRKRSFRTETHIQIKKI